MPTRVRLWLETIAAFVFLWIATWAGGVIGYVLIVAAFTLIFEASTAWLARQSGAGGLSDHRQ